MARPVRVYLGALATAVALAALWLAGAALATGGDIPLKVVLGGVLTPAGLFVYFVFEFRVSQAMARRDREFL